MNKSSFIKLLILFGCHFFAQQNINAQKKDASLLLSFKYTANNKPLVLADSGYTNTFGENYSVTKLRYYISNVCLVTGTHINASKDVFLIDAANEDSIALQVAAGSYNALVFTLGIDSALNSSGAQDGALDPLKGMFWTWNSGYVFFKLEGYSTASTADLQRIEHHIGGYTTAHKASRQIRLLLNEPLVIKKGDQQQLIISLNLDKYWKAATDNSIASNALIMVPGETAKRVADNFQAMFTISSTN
jgi:hypothetical protein